MTDTNTAETEMTMEEIPRKRKFNEAAAASALEFKKLKLLEEVLTVKNIVSFIFIVLQIVMSFLTYLFCFHLGKYQQPKH